MLILSATEPVRPGRFELDAVSFRDLDRLLELFRKRAERACAHQGHRALDRGYLSELGQAEQQGASNASKLIAIVEYPESGLPADAIPTLKVLIATRCHLEAKIGKLNAEITGPMFCPWRPGPGSMCQPMSRCIAFTGRGSAAISQRSTCWRSISTTGRCRNGGMHGRGRSRGPSCGLTKDQRVGAPPPVTVLPLEKLAAVWLCSAIIFI